MIFLPNCTVGVGKLKVNHFANYQTFVAKDALRPDASINHSVWIVLVSSPTLTMIAQHLSSGRRSIRRPLIKEILDSFCAS